jgi:D-alanyl-D-alanine carboxypeptidase
MIGKLAVVVLILAVGATAGEPASHHAHLPASAPAGACGPAPRFSAAAYQNSRTLLTAPWSVFGRPETGWAIYAPLAAHEIGVDCPGDVEGFAEALASWQRDHRLPATGIMDEATLLALRRTWQGRRPFVIASAHGVCPAPPAALANARTDEGYGGKQVQLRAGALDAYRRMVAAARAQEPVLAADRRMLTIFSGYRDPAADAARCAMELNCNAIVRATCSAHRTGLAMDLYLGAAPGYPPDSSADPNRLYQTRSNAYLWMVAHARGFGFINYPFEPWHWEWTGEPP